MTNLIDIQELIKKWDNSHAEEDVLKRVDAEHPLDFFIGKDDEGKRVFALIANFEPTNVSSSKFLSVIKNKRSTDDRWAVKIKLKNDELEDVFVHLCVDLIEACRTCKNELKGMEIFVTRFMKWQKMMETGLEEMSASKIKGLIGELLFIDRILLNRTDEETAIASWLGPEGYDRDFIFSETWVEVKAIGTGKDSIGISSLDQLNVEEIGYLAVINLDKTSDADADGFSFNEIVNTIILKLQTVPNILFLFQDKLMMLGYRYRESYDNMHFIFNGINYYKVDATFPKLIPENIRSEIVRANYSLSITAIEQWKVEDNYGVTGIS